MFNDLNNSNNQGQPAVDDIFAETEKTTEGASTNSSATNSGIETRRVGLAASDGTDEEMTSNAASNKWFKISLIAIITAIVILSGYLVYSKFFKANTDINPSEANLQNSSSKDNTAVTPASDLVTPIVNNDDSFVTPANGNSIASSAPEIIPEIPGVNSPATTSLVTPSAGEVSAANPDSQVDSDSDGLTDVEEKIAGSNINIIDTDNDGLSDYEEVKIYQTNPLSADTDGDTFPDGGEVKSGYNPNGAGKLVKPASSPKPVLK